MHLSDHIDTEDFDALEAILRRDDYPAFLKKLKTSSNDYFFRVHDPQNVVLARSRAFETHEERDRAYEKFLDFVEIEIHNRRQRRLFL
jgi:hypothetical protein